MALDRLAAVLADAVEDDDDDVLARAQLGLVQELARRPSLDAADDRERARGQERRPERARDGWAADLAGRDRAWVGRVWVADL